MVNSDNLLNGNFPTTRYAGSKKRLLPQLYEVFNVLNFNSATDLFSGTSSVAYLLKKMGKKLIVNDYLHSNYFTGIAIIENNQVKLTKEDIVFLSESGDEEKSEKGMISKTFEGYYFTNEENEWLDRCCERINIFTDKYKKALAYHSLFQSALRKRPFNLFHRKNLYLRLANVERDFGNVTTWNKPFSTHIKEMADEVNNLVYNNGNIHQVYCKDINSWTAPETDLVYIDPPYVNKGASEAEVDYLMRYHFLEGIARYEEWEELIDRNSPLLAIKDGYSLWPGGTGENTQKLMNIFRNIFEKYKNRILVLSYFDNGVPSSESLIEIMKDYKTRVYVKRFPHKYALRKTDQKELNNEVIIIGSDNRIDGTWDEV